MTPENREHLFRSIFFLAAIALSIISGYNLGNKHGYAEGLNKGSGIALDTICKIIDRTCVDDTVTRQVTPKLIYVTVHRHVTKLTVVTCDTSTYYLTRKTVRPYGRR